MTRNIPVVNFLDAQDTERRPDFVRKLGKGLEEFGFIAIENHGLPTVMLEQAYKAARDTFALPSHTKQRYEDTSNLRQRGYTSFGVERAVGENMPDLKEFWHVGRNLHPNDPLRVRGIIPPNQFPEEVPQFRTSLMALYDGIENLSLFVLDALGEYLEKPRSFFRNMVENGNNVLRIIHYPDVGREIPAGAVRAAAHEDINLLTLMPASTRPGLELMTRDGEWMSVYTPPDVVICDTGDMMSLLTSGRIPATTHRVVNPEASDGGRMSMPFFVHPHPDYVLVPENPSHGQPIRSQDFLQQRLQAIGL